MSKAHSNENHKRLKMLSYSAKATTYLKSTTKDKFFKDSIRRDVSEGELLRCIVKTHYKVLDALGLPHSTEFSDVLNMITLK